MHAATPSLSLPPDPLIKETSPIKEDELASGGKLIGLLVRYKPLPTPDMWPPQSCTRARWDTRQVHEHSAVAPLDLLSCCYIPRASVWSRLGRGMKQRAIPVVNASSMNA